MTQAKIVAAIDMPVSLGQLNKHFKRISKVHGDRLDMREMGGRILIATEGDGDPLGCGCMACDEARHKWLDWTASRFMIVCPDCGNKRCPKATCHDNACTGSNEAGQEGSVYA